VYKMGFHTEVPVMMRTKLIEDQLRRGRLDAKTLDSMFQRRIEEGANCSPFVSQAILATVKEIFAVGPEDTEQQLGLGQIRLLVVAAEEPAARRWRNAKKSPCSSRSMVARWTIRSAWPTASRAFVAAESCA
jgi:hypothetical protein